MKLVILIILIQYIVNQLPQVLEEEVLSHTKIHLQDRKTFLKVHAIAHSHMDVGWQQPYQIYYEGGSGYTSVRETLNSVVNELSNNENYKFIQCEIKFMSMWWEEQSQKQKIKVKQLIDTKQLEFANGGWVQSDEACTWYEDQIEQMYVGHKWLKFQLNYVPEYSWQIDTFGHSRTFAYLYDLMGFNGHILGRVDDYEKLKRMHLQDGPGMEFVWVINPELESYMFTSILFNTYLTPKGFDFDEKENHKWGDVNDTNIKEKVIDFQNQMKNTSLHWLGQNYMQSFGGDFEYTKADMNFQNLNKIFNKINQNEGDFNMNAVFSTPIEYMREKFKENIFYPSKFGGDFFPYRDGSNAFWTGFYTSMPNFKLEIRKNFRFLNIMRNYLIMEIINYKDQLNIQNQAQQILSTIDKYEKSLSILLHHDAITGTHTKQVNQDYLRVLQDGKQDFLDILDFVFKKRIQNHISQKGIPELILLSNFTNTHPQLVQMLNNQDTFNLVIYNPQNQQLTEIISLQVPKTIKSYQIQDQGNILVISEFLCFNDEDCTVYFLANLSPLSFNYYKFTSDNDNLMEIQLLKVEDTESISSTEYQLEIQKTSPTFHLKEKQTQKDFQFTIQYNEYQSSEGSPQASGSYIFRPKAKDYRGEQVDFSKAAYRAQGNLFSLFYIESKKIKITSDVQPLDSHKELFLGITNTGIKNNEEFYTDSNGLFIEKRKRNYREFYELQNDEFISQNMYPVTSFIMIEDNNKKLTVMNDRSQAGSSLIDGQINLLIHRNPGYNDNRGLNEDFSDNDAQIRKYKFLNSQIFKHLLCFDCTEEQLRHQQFQNESPQILLAFKSGVSLFQNTLKENKITTLNVPQFIKYTVQSWSNDEFLIRLQNLKEKSEYELDFQWDEISILEETTPTGNAKRNEVQSKRIEWGYLDQDKVGQHLKKSTVALDPTKINLKFLEIRTFKARLRNKKEYNEYLELKNKKKLSENTGSIFKKIEGIFKSKPKNKVFGK